MKKIVFILMAFVAIAACKNENKDAENAEAVLVSTANFEEDVAGLTGKKIAVEGTVVHVCKQSGKRFFVGEERIKVVASDKIGSFDTALEGSEVHVEGILQEERIDEAYLVDWEGELEGNAAVQEKEVAHKGEPGHEHAEETEDPNAAARAKIAGFRKQLKESGKEYLSLFTIKVLEVNEKK